MLTNELHEKPWANSPFWLAMTKDGQRSCLHCGTHYIYRQHTQKYCSEPCRIKAWQERTGKELKLKKKK